ncbi:glutamate--tRNA ligase family protein, partial [Corynebacterium diphtheriae]
LVNPVDDALMGITHVLRGEDLLSSTPRRSRSTAAARDAAPSIAVFGHCLRRWRRHRAVKRVSSPEETEARHRAAGRDPKLGYDGHDRDLTDEQIAAFEAEGRAPVWRLRMPDEDITFTDLVRGEITFKAGSVPDFVVVRADGSPLYTLVNPVDDALMGITHVLRGEDLLSSTPRRSRSTA